MDSILKTLMPTFLKWGTPVLRHLAVGAVAALTAWLLTTFQVSLSPDQQTALVGAALTIVLGIIKWAAEDHSHVSEGKQVAAIATATGISKADVIAMAAQAASGNAVSQADAAAPKTKADLLKALP